MDSLLNLTIIKKNTNFISKIFLFLFFLLISFETNFFYLFDANVVNLSDISLIVLVFISIVILITKNGVNLKNNKLFFYVFIGTILLSIFSSYQSYILYSQPFLLGIRAQRKFIIFPLFYYVFCSLEQKKIVNKHNLINVIYFYCIIEMLVGFLQYIFIDSYVFTYVYSGGRYGSVRLYFSDIFIIFTIGYSLIKLLRCFNFKHLLYIIVSFLFLAVICKGRMSVIACILTIFLFLMFSKIDLTKKISMSIVFISFFVFFLFLPIGRDLLDMFFGTSANDSSSIREIGRNLYFETIKAHPFLGGGFINSLWPTACKAAGFYDNIFLVDNGIFGFMFEYGCLGLILLTIFYIILFKNSFKNKSILNECIIFYLVYSLIGMYTLQTFGISASLIIPTILILGSDNVCVN